MGMDHDRERTAYRAKNGALVVEGIGIKGQSPFVGRFDFATWTYSRRVMKDGLSVFEPLSDDDAVSVKINHNNWERVILDSALLTAHRIGNLVPSQSRKIRPIAAVDMPGQTGDFFKKSFQFSEQMLNADNPEESREIDRQRRNYLSNVASNVRSNNRWGFVRDITAALKQESGDGKGDRTSFYFSNLDAIAIHLLSGKYNRFLAGVDGNRAYWKNVEIPPVFKVSGVPIMHMVNPYFSFLEHVRESELPAVPSKIIDPRDYKKISLPEPEGGVKLTDMLKRVLQHQRFTMREGGFSVRLGNAGDVDRMVVVESNGLIFAKAETKFGDLSAVVDKDEASGWFSDVTPEFVVYPMSPEEMAVKSRLAILVGEVYAEYLCGKIKTLTGEKPVRKTQEAQDEPESRQGARAKKPLQRVVIIDERTKSGGGDAGEGRRPYTGKLVPDIVQYSGYVRPRPGGASPETIRKAVAWHEETGLDLPVYDPSTQEAIPPGVKPPGAKAYIKGLPEFWKRELSESAFKPIKGFAPKYIED